MEGFQMDLIEDHPLLDLSYFKKGRMVEFTFDGVTMNGFEDAPIAAALHANGVRVYRETPNMKRPRGFFCAIGKCSSCFMVVDGVPNVRTCITPLKAGMNVETQRGRGRVVISAIPPE
jgi:predicted molibdopterin-dependent oxidoreductase YjgC